MECSARPVVDRPMLILPPSGLLNLWRKMKWRVGNLFFIFKCLVYIHLFSSCYYFWLAVDWWNYPMKSPVHGSRTGRGSSGGVHGYYLARVLSPVEGLARTRNTGERCPYTNSWTVPLFIGLVALGVSASHRGAAPLTHLWTAPLLP